jgi:stage II sporulation protein D
MKYYLIFLCIISSQLILGGEEISVGLLTSSVVKRISISSKNAMKIEAGKNLFFYSNGTGSEFSCQAEGSFITLKIDGLNIGEFKELTFSCSAPETMKLKSEIPDLRSWNYTGIVKLKSQNGRLILVNKLDIDEYLTGVLRGEIGFDKPSVVYEVHAIISATYAKRFSNKHEHEGFNVCDQTHCQVFKGYFNYEPYLYSIQQTKGIYIYDSISNELAEGLFHSNCGGFTCNSEDVWLSRLNYCRSTADTFCRAGKHANWEVKIPLAEFLDKLNLDTLSVSCEDICNYNDIRVNEIRLGGNTYKTTTLRNLFKLKSAYFSWECDEHDVIISGRGFGHGVGLCQEGAIEMASQCFTAQEIIHHYYKDVEIRHNGVAIP